MRTRIVVGFSLAGLAGLFLFWYLFIALDAQVMSQQEIVSAYEYEPANRDLVLTEVAERTFRFSYTSLDGDVVNGQISYPHQYSQRYPVLIGVAAMGRSYVRWWTDSVDGRPRVTNVNKITELADARGYVVIAQDNLDIDRVAVVGYSMGGQISLLLGALDDRISTVIAIVPPWIDDKVAVVAPKNLVALLQGKPVLLITASQDEEASTRENQQLYALIPGPRKQRHDIEGSHILPVEYVDLLVDWL